MIHRDFGGAAAQAAAPLDVLSPDISVNRRTRTGRTRGANPSTDNADSQNLILYEVYENGILVADGVVGGTNTIAYCRFGGPMEIELRAIDTSGNRSGPSNAITFPC